MEKFSASTKSLSGELSKRPEEQSAVEVTKALASCALHFRQELTDLDYEIYLKGLAQFSGPAAVAGIDRAMRETTFMPKLKEIIERIPEMPVDNHAPDDLKLVREFVEPYTRDLQIRVFQYEGGYRQIKLERIA